MYIAKNHETGAETVMTREEVQKEITHELQTNMGVVFGEGMTDEEIAADVAENLDARFEEGAYDMGDYEIIQVKE